MNRYLWNTLEAYFITDYYDFNDFLQDDVNKFDRDLNHIDLLIIGYYKAIEKIPYSIGRLHNLKTLNLKRNNIIKLPNSLNNLKNLKRLNLISNKIESIDLKGFDWQLKFLNISDNKNYKGINQKDIKHSIDYVSDNLDLIDDQINESSSYKVNFPIDFKLACECPYNCHEL